jgi:hypothetical protein
MIKLWSVKAFNWEEKIDLKIINLNEEGKDESPKLAHYIRKLVVVGTNLTWEKAKALRKQYHFAQAFITKNVKESELKVIKLSEAN